MDSTVGPASASVGRHHAGPRQSGVLGTAVVAARAHTMSTSATASTRACSASACVTACAAAASRACDFFGVVRCYVLGNMYSFMSRNTPSWPNEQARQTFPPSKPHNPSPTPVSPSKHSPYTLLLPSSCQNLISQPSSHPRSSLQTLPTTTPPPTPFPPFLHLLAQQQAVSRRLPSPRGQSVHLGAVQLPAAAAARGHHAQARRQAAARARGPGQGHEKAAPVRIVQLKGLGGGGGSGGVVFGYVRVPHPNPLIPACANRSLHRFPSPPNTSSPSYRQRLQAGVLGLHVGHQTGGCCRRPPVRAPCSSQQRPRRGACGVGGPGTPGHRGVGARGGVGVVRALHDIVQLARMGRKVGVRGRVE